MSFGLSGTPAFWLACSARRAACSTLATLVYISYMPSRLSRVNSSLDVHAAAAYDSRRLERIGHGADLVESKDEARSGRHDPCGAACPSSRVSSVSNADAGCLLTSLIRAQLRRVRLSTLLYVLAFIAGGASTAYFTSLHFLNNEHSFATHISITGNGAWSRKGLYISTGKAW